MHSLPTWLIPATLHGSLVILLVWTVGPLLRRWLGARVAYLLWAVVLAHLLLPWLPASPIPWPAAAMPASPSPAATRTAFQVSATVEPAGRITSARSEAPLASRSPASWALRIWIAGMAIVLGFSAVRTVRAARLARHARDISPHPALQKLLESLGQNSARLRIRETRELRSPALCGLWRPTILLPTGWEHRLTPPELECVLRHEIGHLERGDLAWRWAFLLARAVHWFNPLVWMAERSARVHQEMACDEWVLAQKNAPATVIYGETLLTLARQIDLAPSAFPLQAGMAESKTGLKRRLRHMTTARPHGWRAFAAGGLIAAGFLVLTGPAKSTPSSAKPAAPQSSETIPTSAPPRKFTQVQIESKFVQVPAELAAQLLETSPNDGIAGASTVFTNEQFQRTLRRLDQKPGIDLLSAPRVTAKSGQRAVINLIREFKYPVKFDPPDARSPVATPRSFETRNLGVTLEVEATVAADGGIDLALSPEVVEFTGFVNFGGRRDAKANLNGDAAADTILPAPDSSGVINQPIFSVRKMTTSLSLHSGQTALVGGIQSEAADFEKIFASNRPTTPGPKRSLLIFVTATLIDARGIPSPAPSGEKTPVSPPKNAPPASGLPYSTPVAGKPGFVTSPHAPSAGYVDVRGYAPNAEVKDPYSDKKFLVP